MKTKKLSASFSKINVLTYAFPIVMFAIVQILKSTGNLSSLFSGLLVPLCTYIILAISLNINVGISGELSLGHAGFMCVGAYASSLFSVCTKDILTSAWIRFPLAILIGGIVAAIFGIIIGIPILRLRGDYLAIVTLAFGEIVKNICSALYFGYDSKGLHASFTSVGDLNLEQGGRVLIKGPLGISGTPRDSTFVIGFILVLITIFVCLNFINSRAGRAVMAIRDNRIAAESIGINITKYKLIPFCLSAFFAGIAGVLYSHNLSILAATSKNFGYNMSILILVFVVLGGMKNTLGSMIAAVVLTLLPEMLRGLADYRMLIYAVLLIVMMIFTSSPQLVAFRERLLAPVKAALRKNGKKKEAKQNANA